MGASFSVEQSAVLSGGLVLALGLALSQASRRSKDSIPVIGVGSGLFATQVASVRSVKSFQNWIADGYRQYKAGVFKVRSFRDWLIIISGPELIDELRRAPDDVLSFREAVADSMQADYTLGDWRDESLLHVGLIKARLTRSLPHLFPSAMDEINAAYEDEVTSKLNGNEWTTMSISEALMRVVCRTSNRIFVGLQLCRNPEYVDLNVRYTIDVAISASIIKQFPSLLKPLAGRFLTPIPRTYKRAEKVMIDFLEERKRLTTAHGKDWEDKPDDFLQWILETAEPRETETFALMTRLLRLNFAAIHTTALSFTFALYHIAADPENGWIRTPLMPCVGQDVWLCTQLEAAGAQRHWTQGIVTHVHAEAGIVRPTFLPASLATPTAIAALTIIFQAAARNLSYSVAYRDRTNRRAATTVGPAMIRARRHLLPSEDGL
ncbi:cytochrome P450 [Auricularia subglabra TFB-10046 SS5]|nr:cytochrome P450 [Auricularia subglabra TFB-10046 SS5]